MKRISYYVLILCMFLIGIISYLVWNNIIIMQTTSSQLIAQKKLHNANITKKKINAYYWYNDQWQKEEIEIIWPTALSNQLTHALNAWLSLIQEEQHYKKHTAIQSIAISINDEALISFDQNPFDKTMSTFTKWIWIESLLKTIRELNTSIKTVRFLVHHKPLNDYHLDFINPWPIEGFYEK